MKVIITGSTGMVGGLILQHCLNSVKISKVLSLVRRPIGIEHHKLTEIRVQNFEDYDAHEALFKDVGCAFFCIGVYTGQFTKELFKKITVDYPVKFAATLKKHSPTARLCLLSGAGADRTEKSTTDFARFKGMAENEIEALDLIFFAFRPGYIYPVSPRKEPNLMYRISRAIYPIIKMFGKNASIRSTELAAAMFHVGITGADKRILENKDILEYV